MRNAGFYHHLYCTIFFLKIQEGERKNLIKNPRETDIQYLKGIGPARAALFKKRGISTVEDMFYYFPRRYEDRTHFIPISRLREGAVVVVKAGVLAAGRRSSQRRRGFVITEAAVADDTGKIFCVWFNQPYLARYLKPGTSVILYGRVERYGGRLQMSSPEFEIITAQDESLSAGRIVPVYAVPEGVSQRMFRRLMYAALELYVPRVADFLPYDIRSRNNLLNIARSLRGIHFPDDPDLQRAAYERLAFEEFFLFQIPLALRKLNRSRQEGIAHIVDGSLVAGFTRSLPFTLTSDQHQVFEEIKNDMAQPYVMQRLLQGDVGSGKTVVATLAALVAVQGGWQAAFMAPTEVLAKQHFEKIRNQLSLLHRSAADGMEDTKDKIAVGLLVSGMKQNEKEDILGALRGGDIDILIGTHSLLEESVQFKKLGLVIIDEQHKFGVGQRALLPKKGLNPDLLIMTATPIPRTLAITMYGDLDCSVIRHMPAGRKPVKTLCVAQAEREKAYITVKKEVAQGGQAYIVFPVIEESYALDIKGAEKMYEELRHGIFRTCRVGLLHGRLKQSQQDHVMAQFKKHELDILAATTILEVGIDIAEASCMVIEHAERFGLSQLHQLRGRVGRGERESLCILVADASTDEARARLEAMVAYNDGFKIAEEDLKIRGPGEFFGARQHGLSDLKIGDPLTQLHLLKRARDEAIRLVRADPRLSLREHLCVREKLTQRFPGYETLVMVG